MTVCVEQGPTTQRGEEIKMTQILPGGNSRPILSENHPGRPVSKRVWFTSAFFVFIALAFPAYSWFDSLSSLPPKTERTNIVRKPITMAPLFLNPQVSSRAAAPLAKRASHTPMVKSAIPKSKTPATRLESTSQAVTKAVGKQPEGKQPLESPTKPPGPPQPAKPSVGREETPKNTLFDQALAFHKQGKLQEAKTAYESCLKQSPYLVSALNNMGVIYIHEKNYTAAHDVLERATTANAAFSDAYYNLACLYALQTDVEKGVRYLEMAIARDASIRQRAKEDKDLENLRGQVEFERILEDVKVTDKKPEELPDGSAVQLGKDSGYFREAAYDPDRQPGVLPDGGAFQAGSRSGKKP